MIPSTKTSLSRDGARDAPRSTSAPCPGSVLFPGQCGAAPAFLAGPGHLRLLQSRSFSEMCGFSSGPNNKFSPLGLFAPRAVTGLQSWGACNAPGGCGERGRLCAGRVVLATPTQDPRSALAALPGHCQDTTAPYPAAATGKEVVSPSALCVPGVCAVPHGPAGHRPSLRARAEKLPLPPLPGAVTRCRVVSGGGCKLELVKRQESGSCLS